MDVLLGVGNDANGDDGIGPWIARRFNREKWHAIDCFTVPENYTGDIKRLQPRRIVIVDAADMDLQPGSIRVIPRGSIGSATFFTHAMPLSMFIDYLDDVTDADVTLIGIQPRRFDSMSSEVRNAGIRLLEMLRSDSIGDLPRL
ncbi:MAG: hydrogenase maturation peptidase HycI [Thermoplasmatota archaeon]